ncbi:MAG: type IV secretion system DNA-binding domain-containing protein [Candidatus Moranbacteria bacterium]|nr:type IV secretion system DNA-binding domain-containing protein [Candidatus Moranbacteria bacterium]
MSDVTFFAKTNFRNEEQTFGIKTDDRRRHMYVIGKTGMGKTNLLEHMAIQDIKNGHGIAYVDPHGDTAEKIIKTIPSNRINDVIYFNPADQDYPIAFNVMEKVDPECRHLVASGLVGVFKKIWADSWGPRLEYILRNAILSLLEYPGATLLGVTRMLVDKNYRIRVVNKLTDPVVRSFWVDEFTKWNERVLQEVVSPIQNKVGQFLSSALIRNIVGQTKSSFDIREIMDNKKILILNLSKGRIGEDNSALLGAMMITKIQLAAMARIDIPEEERKDFYLYVDEFQNFATESFANILSEARKYRLNLTLANQYITQIDEIVRDAIFGNAGTLVTFRVGAVDAEFMEKEFEPIFMLNDLVNLPKYNIYLKLMIDGIAGDAFSAVTLPPIDIRDTEGNAGKVIKVSRERYASSRAEVEDKINRWSGMLPAETVQKIERPSNQKTEELSSPVEPVVVGREASQVAKQLFNAVCDTCGVGIQVPFEPDGRRPTFCRECLKDYQRTMARGKDQESRIRNPELVRKNNIDRNKEKEVKKTELKAYIPQENPLKLSQIQHVAPKKFQSTRKKPEVNLEEVRKLIKESRNEN